MSTVVNKILCPSPEHPEETPSCAVYADGTGYCFGCQRYFQNVGEPTLMKEKVIENIAQKIEYIKGLPLVDHRGLTFHYDSSGYFIIWPDSTYYKCRRWASLDTGSRYLSPSGHRKPWFMLTRQKTTSLIVVEGEINALSLNILGLNSDILSPGSANNFSDAYMRSNLTYFRKYKKILIITDSDPPGLKAAIELKNLLLPIVNDITINLMAEDCNEILTKNGKEELRKEAHYLGMS